MSTCWFTILYIMVKRDSFLLVSSDFHFMSSSRSVTIDLLWYRCLTNLARLRWIIDNVVDVYSIMWVPDAAGEFNC